MIVYWPLALVNACPNSCPAESVSTAHAFLSRRWSDQAAGPLTSPPGRIIDLIPRVVFPALTKTLLASAAANLALYHCGAHRPGAIGPNGSDERQLESNCTGYRPFGTPPPEMSNRYTPCLSVLTPTAKVDPTIHAHVPLSACPAGFVTLPVTTAADESPATAGCARPPANIWPGSRRMIRWCAG